MAIACVACSSISFFIGFSLPHDNSDKTAQAEKQENSDSEYEGLYLAEYYENGKLFADKIYLNANHDCKNPDYIYQRSCEWAIKDGRLVTTSINGSGSPGKTQEECQKRLEEQENSRQEYNYYYYDGTIGYKILETDEKHKADGYVCIVSPITERKYDILNDGSLSGDNKHYYKR